MHALPLISLGTMVVVEAWDCLTRFDDRKRTYAVAQERAAELGRPLVVIGDPDGGTHTRMMRAYDCGDVCLDLNGCDACPVQYAVDITKGPIPEVPDDSAVVYVSCVLEYVHDFEAAWREILRMAGTPENVFLVQVQSRTMTSVLYPGAKWILNPVKANPAGDGTLGTRPEYEAQSVPTAWKVGALAVIGGLLVWSFWPSAKKVTPDPEGR